MQLIAIVQNKIASNAYILTSEYEMLIQAWYRCTWYEIYYTYKFIEDFTEYQRLRH